MFSDFSRGRGSTTPSGFGEENWAPAAMNLSDKGNLGQKGGRTPIGIEEEYLTGEVGFLFLERENRKWKKKEKAGK